MTMKRKEQIKEAAYEAKAKHIGYGDSVVYAFIDGAEWADAHPNWISVEDELPPCNVFVLTCDGQGNTNLLMLAGNGRWYDKAVGLHRNVTHWMPLPAPPKKGGEK